MYARAGLLLYTVKDRIRAKGAIMAIIDTKWVIIGHNGPKGYARAGTNDTVKRGSIR